MNESGTLKITHKARIKFSIGNYVDTVDCNVAHMSACHLLLGRPWQFDLDATHGGRSNNYSFMHKGIHHVLTPMPDSAIKAEVFAPVKVKKKPTTISPKPRTALLQEGENDVVACAQTIAPKNPCSDPKIEASIFEAGQNVPSIGSEIICKRLEPYTIQFGSFSVPMKHDMLEGDCLRPAKKIHEFSVESNKSSNNMAVSALLHGDSDAVGNGFPNMAPGELYSDPNIFAGSHDNQVEFFQCKHVSPGSEDRHHENRREFELKPRTAFFQGRENGKPMACRVIRFGSFSIDRKQIKMTHERELDSTLALSSRIFVGNNLAKKYRKARKASNSSEQIVSTREGPT
jgi:hypothetical protein